MKFCKDCEHFRWAILDVEGRCYADPPTTNYKLNNPELEQYNLYPQVAALASPCGKFNDRHGRPAIVL